jgi:parallel beta-helix repeat protein
MKIATIVIVLAILLIPFQSAEAKKPAKSEIRLTASQVDGADDIEKAIITATDKGSREGTVILDGREGPFVFSTADRSVNIFVSSLDLKGEEQARIEGCDDGLFFEGTSIHDVKIEKITFVCSGDGLEATGAFHDVTLKKNTFIVQMSGILATGASSGWEIEENVIQAGLDGIRISGAKDFKISKNEISGNNGIVVLGSTGFTVKSNRVQAASIGIILGQGASRNTVQANRLSGVRLAGIAIEPGVRDNRILSNKVTCASGAGCLAVVQPLDKALGNKIEGNSRK